MTKSREHQDIQTGELTLEPDMTAEVERAARMWSPWAEAGELERARFETPITHRAWSRFCGGCGEGDFLQRKQKPRSESNALIGQGFPPLPERLDDKGHANRFRTPAGRVHICAGSKSR
jgi:hypothetical protein